jgi:hypothetical protein
MIEAPKTLRVFWQRREMSDPSGRTTHAMIPEIQFPEALLGGPGGVVDVIIDNVAGEYVVVELGPHVVTATPFQTDPRETPSHFHAEGLFYLYRWLGRGSRLDYLGTLGGAPGG